jgi:hypothetical protein
MRAERQGAHSGSKLQPPAGPMARSGLRYTASIPPTGCVFVGSRRYVDDARLRRLR